jgi:uncharacterized protein YdeI (YjbR/CyaY-like superfamily)
MKTVTVKSRGELRAWLEAHHHERESVWLVTYKKPSKHHVPWSDVVDEVLCFGYIDSQPKLLDDERSMIRLSPRSEKSGWSGINKQKIERLIAAGLVAQAGLAAVERAKANGTWSMLDGATALEIPEDLAMQLDARPPARENFEAFPKSVRRAILEWISTAKKPETRAKRVEEAASKAQINERANQWKKA